MENLSVAAFDERWTCSLCEMKTILTPIWTQINTSLHIHHFTWGPVQLFMDVDRNGVILGTWDSAFLLMSFERDWLALKLPLISTSPLLALQQYTEGWSKGHYSETCAMSWYDLSVNINLRSKDKIIFTFHLDLIRELINSFWVLVSQG